MEGSLALLAAGKTELEVRRRPQEVGGRSHEIAYPLYQHIAAAYWMGQVAALVVGALVVGEDKMAAVGTRQVSLEVDIVVRGSERRHTVLAEVVLGLAEE